MSTHKKAPAMRQHGEGQTSEAENLSNGADYIRPTSSCQAPARDDEAARSTPEGVPALPGGPEGGAAALPCLKKNNSITEAANALRQHPPEMVHKVDGPRIWLNLPDGSQRRFGPPTQGELKKNFALEKNIEYMANHFGIERLGFLTLTFADNVTDFREAQRRFNSLATNILRKNFEAWVIVVEPQKRGAVHYHLVVVCRSDIRTSFDFTAFRECQNEYRTNGKTARFYALLKQYATTASPELRHLWAHLREVAGHYGFGRCELLPIRSNAEGIAKYVGKYLEKGSQFRGEQFKGARMVRYSRGWRAVTQTFAWLDTGREWRKLVAQLAHILGCDSLDALKERLGKKWAYHALNLLKTFPDATPLELAVVLGGIIRRPSSIET
ncbi:replication endonuclease [Ruficoccus sp. ZRK36]|uniref:replication endonuclease n=1 Tax=Ruficoccus sp. ZRK36 TaxID=2866311 RepID=UPI001C73B6FB|nr:replication endonuclease [Ruficoccus sp. ZRK36]QYY35265.1 replication endonuclease [Ruficoccus sp. ZRK36]